MKQTLNVIRFELMRNLKKPSFWLVSIALPIILSVYIGICAMTGYNAEESLANIANIEINPSPILTLAATSKTKPTPSATAPPKSSLNSSPKSRVLTPSNQENMTFSSMYLTTSIQIKRLANKKLSKFTRAPKPPRFLKITATMSSPSCQLQHFKISTLATSLQFKVRSLLIVQFSTTKIIALSTKAKFSAAWLAQLLRSSSFISLSAYSAIASSLP